MSDNNKPRAPRSFAVPDAEPQKAQAKKNSASKPAKEPAGTARKPRAVSATVKLIEPDHDYFDTGMEADLAPSPPPQPAKRKSRIGGYITALIGFFMSVGIALWVENIITTLFDRYTWMGWVALGAAALLVLLVLIVIIRELRAMAKLRSVAAMRERAADALATKDPVKLKRATADLLDHFRHNPKTATGRASLNEHQHDIMDATDRYAMAERELLAGLDAQARDLVMAAAKRVSVVTAVSPRAIVDISYVLYENIRLIRVMAEHYGGRTSTLGTLSLAKRVVSHLAITGSIAVGDSIIQQLVGHGMAARISSRLGEGVVNGLMTVRVGLSAIDVCRPAPFSALPQPKISEFLNVLTKFSTGTQDKPDA